MGYSVTVQVNDQKLRDKALAFMQKQFRDWSVLDTSQKWSPSVRGPMLGPELSYDRSPFRIGFDYSSLCDPERHYVWCILHWMALTFGSTYNFPGSNNCPYYIYDGDKRTPVLVGDWWKNRPVTTLALYEVQPDGWFNWTFMSFPGRKKWGISHFKFFIRSHCGLRPHKQKKLIRAELARLTMEWQKEISQ